MKNDRKDPTFWTNERREYTKQAAEVDRDYREFCRRFRGDLSLMPYNEKTSSDGGRAKGFGNLTQLRARIMRGDFMFRCPRPQVTAPRYEQMLFTPVLAQIETLLLQDFVDESDYYREMRRAALDLVLAPRCIVKLNLNLNGKLDLRAQRRERNKADQEFLLYTMGTVSGPMSYSPRVRKTDAHDIHAVQHSQVIAAVQRRELKVPDGALDIMEAHLADHVEHLAGTRETESSRRGRVTIERIHPESYSHDVWAERPYDREWHCQSFVERIEDAEAKLASGEYDSREAVGAITPTHVRRGWRDGSGDATVDNYNRDAIQTKDEHYRCYEVVDLVESQVVRYAEGGTKPLSVRPWTLASILPSGPYEEYSLIEDPDECWGVCPPTVSKDHQEASSEMMGQMTEVVRRCPPMQILNGAVLDEDTQQKILNGDVAEMIVARNLSPDFDMKKVIVSIPAAEIPQQTANVEQLHRQIAEQNLGLGADREQGGNSGDTATRSVIVAQSSSTLSEDGAAGWDDFQTRVLRKVVRIQRGVYSLRQVQDIVGEIALRPGGWPAMGFADADVVNDRNVSCVPGSSRRNESAIVTKMLGEGITLFQVSPLSMTMPKTLAELYRRYFESAGQYGLGFDQVGEVATLEQQIAQQQALMAPPGMAGAPGAPGAPPGAPPGQPMPGGMPPPGMNGNGKPRPSQATEPSPAAQAQGVANVGGGRVATGASEGDITRFLR